MSTTSTWVDTEENRLYNLYVLTKCRMSWEQLHIRGILVCGEDDAVIHVSQLQCTANGGNADLPLKSLIHVKGRPCTTYPSDMRLKISSTGLYTYPDVTVVCGEAQCEDTQQDTLLNPTLIVEVLSESTQAYDRGGKFAHYRKLASLLEYVLIAQTKPHVEHYVRQPDNRWLLAEADSMHDTIHLPSIDCHLALAEVYDKVDIVVD